MASAASRQTRTQARERSEGSGLPDSFQTLLEAITSIQEGISTILACIESLETRTERIEMQESPQPTTYSQATSAPTTSPATPSESPQPTIYSQASSAPSTSPATPSESLEPTTYSQASPAPSTYPATPSAATSTCTRASNIIERRPPHSYAPHLRALRTSSGGLRFIDIDQQNWSNIKRGKPNICVHYCDNCAWLRQAAEKDFPVCKWRS